MPWTPLNEEEQEELQFACNLLENPGLAARMAGLVGAPLEKGIKMLPPEWHEEIGKTVRRALFQSLQVAVASLGQTDAKARATSSDWLHKLLVGASGTLGGAFGLASTAIELPVSTTIMLRSIADIARSEGFDIRAVETKLNCLEVFALGGRSNSDDAAETAYWTVRAALGQALREAATVIGSRGVVDRSAPAIARFVSAIAARFGAVVSEQAAAKAIPVLGAASGAMINVLFIDHFQDMARGHFIIKRLESRHGTETIQSAYTHLRQQQQATANFKA
jgi:hypothetical protein